MTAHGPGSTGPRLWTESGLQVCYGKSPQTRGFSICRGRRRYGMRGRVDGGVPNVITRRPASLRPLVSGVVGLDSSALPKSQLMRARRVVHIPAAADQRGVAGGATP